MIIPSIDIRNGRAVQLIGGETQALDAGDPIPIAERFAVAGEIAVVDLDAALGTGSNADLIRRLLRIAPCRVGGGIRDVRTAIDWLDAGAASVVLGTAANPETLSRLPRERVVAALDARDGEVVVDGWRRPTGQSVLERMRELQGLAGGFLVTFVEHEGRMRGTALERVGPIVAAAGEAKVTIAGGVTTHDEVAAIDAAGADAQVGMGLYTGRLDLADAIIAPLLRRSFDSIWPTVVVDENGVALGLTWSSRESVREAVRTRRGVYQSRSRGIWVKGETSGATQDLLRVDLDCDRDCLRFTVRQHGAGFCHTGAWSCWGRGRGIADLSRKLRSRIEAAPAGSYTRKLLDDPVLLGAKLVEEAGELGSAGTPAEVTAEAADLFYFALVAMARAGVSFEDVQGELDRRGLIVTRRPGERKERRS